ncbi:hypothetical protein AN958_11908 [Leucoagaricus sp. SymC.cos]|nr:hypothetical protein AN958_11908 [Leucoagaricus sp. SymC.cos]
MATRRTLSAPVSSSTRPSVDTTLTIQQATLNASIRAVFRIHYDEFNRYLADYLAREHPNRRETARKKLVQLTLAQFLEFSTDVYDEIIRRKDGQDSFLQEKKEFHPKRNIARQKMAALPFWRFHDLASDVYFELIRRYPDFKEDCLSSSSSESPGYNDHPSPKSLAASAFPPIYKTVDSPRLDHEPVSTEKDISALNQKLVSILKDPKSRKFLRSLQGSQAQLMIDYLFMVLQRPPSVPWFQKHALIALYKLSKSSLLYPRCYILRDISFDSHESGGGFSDIHKGHYGDQQLCLKYWWSVVLTILQIYAKEAILWGQMNHRNIVPFYGIYYLNEAQRQLCLVSPWMRNGDLVQYLKNNPSISRISFIYDVTAGLEYLHSRSLVHSDLKGVNVLVNDAGIACITDFGLSFIRTDQTLAYTIAATTATGLSHHWAAPELLEDDASCTMASDVWALGCVYYEVLTGKVPFQGLSEAQIIRKLISGSVPERPGPSRGIDTSYAEYIVWDLAHQCWTRDAKERPECRQILEALVVHDLAREGEGQLESNTMRRKRHFEEAMRKAQDISLNFVALEGLLCMCEDASSPSDG